MAVWDRCMGYEYTDGLSRGRLRRDYGLVEIIFEQYDTGWHATGIEIQAYRLGRFGVGIVPQVLAPYFGAVESRVNAKELLETVAAKGSGSRPSTRRVPAPTRTGSTAVAAWSTS